MWQFREVNLGSHVAILEVNPEKSIWEVNQQSNNPGSQLGKSCGNPQEVNPGGHANLGSK